MRLLGEIHSHPDSLKPKQAGEYYGRALALARELNMRPLVAHCHLGMGRQYQRTGRDSEGEVELSQARDLYREMDMQFWLEKTEGEMRGLA